MDKNNDIRRNRPTEEGRRNDPSVRDDSAIQPGVQTNSDSKYDDDNQSVTSTSMTDGTLSEFDTDKNADPAFDDIDRNDNNK